MHQTDTSEAEAPQNDTPDPAPVHTPHNPAVTVSGPPSGMEQYMTLILQQHQLYQVSFPPPLPRPAIGGRNACFSLCKLLVGAGLPARHSYPEPDQAVSETYSSETYLHNISKSKISMTHFHTDIVSFLTIQQQH